MRALLAGLALTCLASSAFARPFTIDDMLASESYGQVLFAPSGGKVVVERRGPYDKGVRFTYGFMSRRMTSKIMLFELSRPGALSLAFHQDDDAGYWVGGFSPSGKKLTVFRLRNDKLRLGILDLGSREVNWLPAAPDLPASAPAPVWIDDHRIIYVRFQSDRLPTILDSGGIVQRVMPRRWANAATGRIAAADLASTKFAGTIPYEGRDLVVANVATGQEQVLTSGEISDFLLSTDRRSVAVVELGDAVAPDTGQLVTFFNQSRRRRLRLLDTVTGRVTKPCPNCDLQDGSLNFSDAGQLAVIARRDGATWETAKAHLLIDGELAVQAMSGARSETIVWSGENLLVRSHASGWSGLLAGSNMQPRHVGEYGLVAASGGIVWLSNDEGLWRVGPSLEPKKVAGADHPIVDLDFLDANSTGIRRFRRPEAPLLRRFGAQRDRINFGFESDSPTTLSVSRGSQILAVSDSDKSAITLSTDAHGVGRLYLNSSGSPPRLVDTISARLADVIPPKAIALKRRVGELSVVDWLLVPEGKGPFPLVIHPYQGTTYGDDLPWLAKPEGLSPVLKPSILVANGYAVLLPSIPEGSARHLQETLIDNLDEAVDAGLSTGLIDASRMAIHGHSYGGINALTIATRSSRYRAIISSSALVEFAAAYGSVSPAQKVSFLGGPPLSANIAWYETGQGRFEAAPWSDPERYVRASSFFAADKVQAPLLLIAAEFDYFPIEQAEHLFVSLARLGKDASLLRLYGDGHIRHSPGNIRYEWNTILAFLKEKMPPAANASGERR